MFVHKTEANLSDDYTIYLYKFKKDGDALKYALFSKFYPEKIKFLYSISEIRNIRTNGVVVIFEKDFKAIADKILPQKIIATGFIHNKRVVAFFSSSLS